MSPGPFLASSSLAAYGALSTAWAFGEGARRLMPEGYVGLEAGNFEPHGLVPGPFGLSLAGRMVAEEILFEVPSCPPVDWILPWWNADVSGSAGLEVHLRFWNSDAWSGWYPLGLWTSRSTSFKASDEAAEVKTDTLFLSGKTERYQARVVLSSGEAGSIILRRFGLLSRDKGRNAPPTKPYLLRECQLDVPVRSQMLEAPEVKGRICSPTCCSMALSYLGLKYPVMHVAEDCLDSGAGIYGNWPFNVASLWRLGARARLEFFPNLQAAAGELFGGKLLIASIRFGEGELSDAPISKTAGHLVLVRGIERRGDGTTRVLVNDPAAKDLAGVRRSYLLEEFERAWTGVAYVAEGRR